MMSSRTPPIMAEPTSAPSAPPAPRTVNRTQLCAELSRSRTWLDERIAADPDFPILRHGAQGRPYAFDLAAVRLYLQAEDRAASVFAATTPQARLASIRADIAEQDLAERAAKLIDADGMRALLVKTTAILRAIIGKTVDEVMRRHGFSAAVERDFRASTSAAIDAFEASWAEVLPRRAKRAPEAHPDPT